jgi:DNA-binding NarL/FixJ family response regulator/Tfp pilus assembly protein PilZ
MTNKSETTKASQAPSVFANEIAGFSVLTKLSRRETDILVALIRNITNSEDVAKALGISTHTVNNHLKSIFEKTATNSKTEVLSTFLRFAAEHLQHRQAFARRPKVLIVGDEPVVCEFIATGLRDRDLLTYVLTEPAQAADMVRRFHIDFIVCDISMAECSGFDLLKAVRSVSGAWPKVLFLAAQPTHSLEECMHFGAAGMIEKPLDIGHLYRTVVGHLVESLADKARLLCVDTTTPIQVVLPCQLKIADLGSGGAFVPCDATVQKRNRLTVGAVADITLAPIGANMMVKVRGRVAWRRLAAADNLQAGIGLEFLEVNDADQRLIDELLGHKNNVSYIPIGSTKGEVTLKRAAHLASVL